MAIDKGIDVTPQYTFSTIQFRNETVNVLVTSLIAVLILSNIGSIISKLVYFTRETRFNYPSWLRAFIFANSDDPIRLMSWIMRRYVYRDRRWTRNPSKFRLRRLFLPLLARTLLLIFSIASIAITIPGEKKMPGCRPFDHTVAFDLNGGRSIAFPESVCSNIPLFTDRGTVRSTASYCTCPIGGPLTFDSTAVFVAQDKDLGRIRTNIGSQRKLNGFMSYVEWRRPGPTETTYRTDLTELDLNTHAEVVIRAISLSQSDCQRGEVQRNDTERSILWVLNCKFDTVAMAETVKSHVRTAMVWRRTETQQTRIQLRGAEPSAFTKDCPIDITITRPVVNIVPLAILLVVWCILNVLVSIAVSRHGNTLDASFHIIKEALGHDCTSNPLEQRENRQEIMAVELRKWMCSDGGGHVGFIGRQGDVPVDEFPEGTVVGACSRAAMELERAKVLCGDTVTGSKDVLPGPGSATGSAPWAPASQTAWL